MPRLNSQFTKPQMDFVKARTAQYRLYIALLLKYYEVNGGVFFQSLPKFSRSLILAVAKTFNVSSKINIPSIRSIMRIKKEIAKIFDQTLVTKNSRILIQQYIYDVVATESQYNNKILYAYAESYIRELNIKPVPPKSLLKLVRLSKYNFEQDTLNKIFIEIDDDSSQFLDELLVIKDDISGIARFNYLIKSYTVANIQDLIEKFKELQQVTYPLVLHDISQRHLEKQYKYIANKYPSIIAKIPKSNKYALLMIFCFIKRQEVVDALTGALLYLIKKVNKSGQDKVKREQSRLLVIKKNYNFNRMLGNILDSLLIEGSADEIVESIKTKYSRSQLKQVKSSLDNKVADNYVEYSYQRSRKSYSLYYRKLIINIVSVLDLDSKCPDVANAIALMKNHLYDTEHSYVPDISVSLNELFNNKQINRISEANDNINRIDFELSTLDLIKRKISIKEAWSDGGGKFRNPDMDLIPNFQQDRKKFYDILSLPIRVKTFIAKYMKMLAQKLYAFNRSIKGNEHVHIKSNGYIHVDELEERPEPPMLAKIKQMIFKKWPKITLLEVLRETNSIVDFVSSFEPIGAKECLNKEVIKKRLLLAILGYGTNTGLKSVSSSKNKYDDLKYIKKRYFTPDNLRRAIQKIINKLLQMRHPDIWKTSTTSLASDSKHFKANDQNLISSWHARYHSTGVMVYWHVDISALCVYSQLKKCNSSEVIAMVEGVVKYDCDLVEKNFVDTHGQSEVGFAVTELLGFKLMPRFKNIHLQKLYAPDQRRLSRYKNIQPALEDVIDWDLISKYYDKIVEHIAALKLGYASAESIMAKFSAKQDSKCEFFLALVNIGRIFKTIFICDYLSSLEIREEIQTALNVVERWNGVNNHIFYGQAGKLTNNNPDECELSILCLQLLQLSLVAVNTFMFQQIVLEHNFLSQMQINAKREITVLTTDNIFLYGDFDTNMDGSLGINYFIYSGGQHA